MNNNKQVAVIMGAASGIGLALAKACVQERMHVVMADIEKKNLTHQVSELSQQAQTEVLGVVCDVSVLSDVEQLAKQTKARFNRIDLLINNAGISGRLAPVWELTSEDIRQVLDVNLHGVIHGVQVFLPVLFEQKHRSQVVNMASVYGLCSGSQMAAYAMSKHAIVALSESLYFDLRRLNKPVDVSVVCPSYTNTRLLAKSASLYPDKLHQMMADLLERSRPVEDVANHIMAELKHKTFYILPDKEVKDYSKQRTQALVEQTLPYEHNLEKLMLALNQRADFS